MQNFRTLTLAVNFHHTIAETIAGTKLPKHMADQLDRAFSSIALNLAEGRGKLTNKDKRKFFSIALGSVRECQAIMMLYPNSFDSTQRLLIDKLAAANYLLVKRSL